MRRSLLRIVRRVLHIGSQYEPLCVIQRGLLRHEESRPCSASGLSLCPRKITNTRSLHCMNRRSEKTGGGTDRTTLCSATVSLYERRPSSFDDDRKFFRRRNISIGKSRSCAAYISGTYCTRSKNENNKFYAMIKDRDRQTSMTNDSGEPTSRNENWYPAIRLGKIDKPIFFEACTIGGDTFPQMCPIE